MFRIAFLLALVSSSALADDRYTLPVDMTARRQHVTSDNYPSHHYDSNADIESASALKSIESDLRTANTLRMMDVR